MPLYTVHLYPCPRVGVHRIRAEDPVAAIAAAHRLALEYTRRTRFVINEDVEIDFSDALATGEGYLVDELREDGELIGSCSYTYEDPPRPAQPERSAPHSMGASTPGCSVPPSSPCWPHESSVASPNLA